MILYFELKAMRNQLERINMLMIRLTYFVSPFVFRPNNGQLWRTCHPWQFLPALWLLADSQIHPLSQLEEEPSQSAAHPAADFQEAELCRGRTPSVCVVCRSALLLVFRHHTSMVPASFLCLTLSCLRYYGGAVCGGRATRTSVQ